MSLVSMLQRDFVKKRAWVEEDNIFEAISIASFLPGPLAVNISTFIGFVLRGWFGALAAITGVLLPSFLLIIILTYFYFEHIEILWVTNFFKGVMPVIVAVIAHVALGMFKKNIKSYYQYYLVMLSIGLAYFLGGMTGILSAMLVCGIIAYLIETRFYSTLPVSQSAIDFKLSAKSILIPTVLLMFYFLILEMLSLESMYWELAQVFSKVSVTLFGGGYVFIPMMQEIIVGQKGWLSNQEFVDAIAMGQITPGPILISAAFVGFKLLGIPGALVATGSIFLPSALLMLIIGQVYNRISDNQHVIYFFKGLKASIIGLILYSSVIIFLQSDNYFYTAAVMLISLFVLIKFDLNLLLLICLSGTLGIFAL
jgi:chromate transporter